MDIVLPQRPCRLSADVWETAAKLAFAARVVQKASYRQARFAQVGERSIWIDRTRQLEVVLASVLAKLLTHGLQYWWI